MTYIENGANMLNMMNLRADLMAANNFGPGESDGDDDFQETSGVGDNTLDFMRLLGK